MTLSPWFFETLHSSLHVRTEISSMRPLARSLSYCWFLVAGNGGMRVIPFKSLSLFGKVRAAKSPTLREHVVILK